MFRGADKWLISYLTRKHPRLERGPVHVMIAICDHFEPFHDASREEALHRLDVWRQQFPASIRGLEDGDGCPPKQTFFYPIEQYDAQILDALARLCEETGSEVEIHLHHHNSSESQLAEDIEKGKHHFTGHGLLSRDVIGNVRFGFIHGNWALDNSHPQGQGCGVNSELGVLRRAGCYADFTMPSAPHPTQTRTVNSIYYAQDTPEPKSHDSGQPATVAHTTGLRDRVDQLLLVQGPLALNWRRRKWGILPRLENSDLTPANPPTSQRFWLWCRQQIHVAGKPNWIFIKLHTHGGIPPNFGMLLGPAMREFRTSMSRIAPFPDHPIWLHHVTAREMVNIIHAAEDGLEGNPGSPQLRNHLFRRVTPVPST
jgi:hypothetical protein